MPRTNSRLFGEMVPELKKKNIDSEKTSKKEKNTRGH